MQPSTYRLPRSLLHLLYDCIWDWYYAAFYRLPRSLLHLLYDCICYDFVHPTPLSLSHIPTTTLYWLYGSDPIAMVYRVWYGTAMRLLKAFPRMDIVLLIHRLLPVAASVITI